MKKFLSVALAATMLVGLVATTGCGKETLKFGLGVDSYYSSANDATAEANGSGEADGCAVAVLVDKNGKVVQMAMDVSQVKPAWTAEGKTAPATAYLSKRQKGDNYNMAAYGKKKDGSDGKPLEWYAQADAFIAACIGKTADEIKALVNGEGYGTDELQKANCTIHVSDFVKATVKAIENATESTATADMTLCIGTDASWSHSSSDASADANGNAQVDTVFVALVKDSANKVVVAATDSFQAKFAFDATGKSVGFEAKAIATKLDLHDNYNMAAYGKKHDGSEGKPLEWYQQAEAYNKTIVGKDIAGINALAGADTYATGELAKAGCTISVGAMNAAAADALK